MIHGEHNVALARNGEVLDNSIDADSTAEKVRRNVSGGLEMGELKKRA